MKSRHLLSALLIGLGLSSAAQPYKFGCHHFRNAAHHPHRPTDIGMREGIEDVIARSDTFDILHYDIAIDVTDVPNQRITATTTISLMPLIGGSDPVFDLIDALVVDSVTVDGLSVPFTHASDLLTVDMPASEVGTTYAVAVHYAGDPERDPQWGGFYFQSSYIYNLGIGLSTIPPNFGKVWYPCFDSFVERASYTYHVKSRGLYRAHCQGEFLGEVQLGGDTVVRSYTLDQSIPTHISAIAVADFRDSTTIHTGAFGDIPITLTAKPTALNLMVQKFASLGDAIDCYEFWYGPYPYDRVGYVMATDGALEIPENVAYPDFMNTQSLFDNRGLFGHELGHHWWGDNVTPRTHNDMWFKEGPAEYSGHLLEEWAFGREAFVDVVKDNMLYVLEQAHLQDDGFQALSPMPDEHIYGLHTYYKGAAVLHNLRGYLGDTLFRNAMQAVQLANANTTLNAEGFKTELETATGADLAPFFNAQVYSPGFSVFVVDGMTSTFNGTAWTVELTIRQRLRGTTSYHEAVPLDVTLIGPGMERVEYAITASGELTTVELACPWQPAMSVLNGHNRLNQARMDHEFIARDGQTFPSLVPRTEMRIWDENLADSALVRVEHIWAAPEASNTAWGVFELSSTHYWNVDGLWNDGAFRARLNYTGNDPEDLDNDLYGTTEAQAMLVYRANASEPWAPAPYTNLVAGVLTNGSGYVEIDTLLRGQYAFANGNVIVGLSETDHTIHELALSPNPADASVRLTGRVPQADTYTVAMVNSAGQCVSEQRLMLNAAVDVLLPVHALTTGTYQLHVEDANGTVLRRLPFVVKH